MKIGRAGVYGVTEDEMIAQLLQWIPLTDDIDEVEYVDLYLCDLLEAQDPRVMQPDALKVIGQAFIANVGANAVSAKKPAGLRIISVLNVLFGMEGISEQLQSYLQSDERMAARFNKQMEIAASQSTA
jgi:hypothetical protein